MRKIINWFKSSKSDFAFFVLFLILANIAGYNSYKRFDLTATKSYSLSKASKQVVKNLEQPLSVHVFFDENLPPAYSQIALYVKDLLVEYKSNANKNFNYSYMDMKKTENQELASDYGLYQIQIQELKNNEVGFKQVYMGIVISYGDNIETINPITSVDGFEYTLTTKISNMIDTADKLAKFNDTQKIALKFYMSDVLKNLRIANADKAEEIIKNAFDVVNKKNLDKLELNIISPKKEEVSELISKYGLQGISYGNSDGSRDTAVIGLVMEYEDNFKIVPVQIQQSIFGYVVSGLENLEENISASLESLLSKVSKIGYIVGHNELDRTNERYSANFDRMVSGIYELVDIDLSEEDIPNGMASIIINGPQFDFSEEELYKIDQFVMRGGNVMFFIDSMNKDGTAGYYGAETYVPNELNIDRLLNAYGIKRELNYVFDTSCYSTQSQNYGKQNLYWAPALFKQNFAKKHPVSANMAYVLMLQNGSLDVSLAEENKDAKVTVLAKSSPKSWTQNSNIVLNPIMIVPPVDETQMKSENLAVLVEGKFQSAFKTAPVLEKELDEQNKLSTSLETQNHLSSSILPGKIFVIGSSYVTTAQLINEEATTPIALFIMNAVDYLNGNEDFCSMRTKNIPGNTLKESSNAAMNFWKYFNIAGLVILIALTFFIVLVLRQKRRKEINNKYNPDDTRTIKK